MTNPVDLTALSERMGTLERQNRSMRACLVCLFSAATCAALVAANAPENETLEVKQLIIRDDDGNKRIVVGKDAGAVAEGVQTGVFVYDEEGKSCVSLTAANGNARLHVAEDGKHRLSLGTGKQRYAGLLIYAEPGNKAGQILLFYTDDGKPVLGMNDTNGKTRIMMALDNKRSEKPLFALQDANQKSFFSKAQP